MLRFLQFLAIAGTLFVLAVGTARSDDTYIIPPDDGLGSGTPVTVAVPGPACNTFNTDGTCAVQAPPCKPKTHPHRSHRNHRSHRRD